MHPSQSLQKYAEEKIRHQVEKFVSKPVEAHVTFSVDNNSRRKIVHCALTAGDGFAVQVEHECDDMYGSIDHVLDKLATQLKRKKDRLKAAIWITNLIKRSLTTTMSKSMLKISLNMSRPKPAFQDDQPTFFSTIIKNRGPQNNAALFISSTQTIF
jgi:ribosomal subunit interface protein